MTCPDLLLLSQLLDAELAAAEAAPLRDHVATCGGCRDRLARLERATEAARAALARDEPASAGAAAPDCLRPEQIAAWAGRALADTNAGTASSHLEACDVCLGEALAALRTLARLDAGPMAAVPEALRARVASRWVEAPGTESITTLVVRLARAGLALLERHVVAPVVEVTEIALPAAAIRGGEGGGAVSFRIRSADAQIRATVVPEGDAVALALSLFGADDSALVDQRVYLRRHGRSLYSARTDEAGTLRLPRIEPGVYEVACPGIGTSFRLDLRP